MSLKNKQLYTSTLITLTKHNVALWLNIFSIGNWNLTQSNLRRLAMYQNNQLNPQQQYHSNRVLPLSQFISSAKLYHVSAIYTGPTVLHLYNRRFQSRKPLKPDSGLFTCRCMSSTVSSQSNARTRNSDARYYKWLRTVNLVNLSYGIMFHDKSQIVRQFD